VDPSLKQIVDAFGEGLHAIDNSNVAHKRFQPGVGPYGEAQAVPLALQHMREHQPRFVLRSSNETAPGCLDSRQMGARGKDCSTLRGQWTSGRTLVGKYSSPISREYKLSLGDCMKLLQSGLPERKGIIVFGYEHAQAVVPLDPAIRSFELLAGEIMQVKLTPRVERRIEGLTHPVHQVLRVFGWGDPHRLDRSSFAFEYFLVVPSDKLGRREPSPVLRLAYPFTV
jgi:hypothetical protein